MLYKFLTGFIHPINFVCYCADQVLGLIKSIGFVSHKTTLMLHSQSEQIHICQLAMAVYFAAIKYGGIQQAQIARPALRLD